MGESLFGKLRDVLSREQTSDISDQGCAVNPTANLARIGLASGTMQAAMRPHVDALVSDPLAAAAMQPGLPLPNVAPVGIQFFAKVPSQEGANEIKSVSQGGENCLSADAKPVGDGIWTVAVTLCMAPVPQEIHAIETVLQTWAQKLGGTSKGWGLSQNQAA